MIVKNISVNTYTLDSLDGTIVRTGETADLNIFSKESRDNCITLQEGLSRGDIIILNSPVLESSPMSSTIKKVQRSGESQRFAIYRNLQQKLVPISPINKRTHMKMGNIAGQGKLQPISRRRMLDDLDNVNVSDGRGIDNLEDLYPGYEIDLAGLRKEKQGTVVSHNDLVQELGVPRIDYNGKNMTVISNRQPGVIDSTQYIKDVAVFQDSPIVRTTFQKQHSQAVKDIKRRKCIGLDGDQSCTKAPIKNYRYCFKHMPKNIREHYLKSKGLSNKTIDQVDKIMADISR